MPGTVLQQACKPQLKCILFIVSVLTISALQESTNEVYAFAESAFPSGFNFAAVGDMGCTTDAKNTVGNILNRDPELVFGLGDYVYPSSPSADCWFDLVDPIDEKMKVAVGNHDLDELNPLMLHFNFSEQFYSFDYGSVHVLAMSTEIPLHVGSEQFEFVITDLSKAAKNPDTNWIFVFIHKMLYSSPSRELSTSFQDTLRITYHPLFDKYGVDLVIQGHFHIYERTYPLNFNSETQISPQVVDTTNGNNYTNPQGPVFVTVGTGGIGLHKPEGKEPYMVTQYSGFGILDLAVLKDGSTIDARFYANNGTIKDEFTIMKTNSSNNSRNANSLYHYMPYITLSGFNYTDVESDKAVRLTQFSVSAWFNGRNFPSSGLPHGYIVNTTDYRIRMEDDGSLRASYETYEGDTVGITSPDGYNDDKWHYVVMTYDGFLFKLYIDNVLTSYRPSTIASGEGSIQSIRIGESFFGSIDEVRIWNRALSDSEIEQGYSLGIYDSTGQVFYLPDPMKLQRHK